MVQESYYDHGFTCAVIISDDDSTMKSNLRHSWLKKIEAGMMTMDEWPRTKNNNKKTDNGRLPLDVPPPKLLADFNHRVKSVGKAMYALAGLSQKESMVDKAMAARMKSYWGTMLKQIRYMDWEKDKETIKKKVLAPVEHLFGNHEHCDSQWCYVLKAKNEGKPYLPDAARPIYDKISNLKTYLQLNKAVERFQMEENIKDCLHKFDTQLNEALNMAVSRYVPKFKHFGTTMALDSRVRCVIGAHNMGYDNYYLTLLTNLGCIEEIDRENRHISLGITRINETKLNNKRMKRMKEFKRRRQHGRLAKSRQQIYEERVDRAEKMGTYEAGIAINGDETNAIQQSSAKTKATKTCKWCGKNGHMTWRAKACLHNAEYIATKNKSTHRKQNETREIGVSENSHIGDRESGDMVADDSARDLMDSRYPVVGDMTAEMKVGVVSTNVSRLKEANLNTEKEAADTLLQMCIFTNEAKFSKSANNVKTQSANNAKTQALIVSNKVPKPSQVLNKLDAVSTTVYNVPVSTAVHFSENNFMSTGVEGTCESKKMNSNSSDDENILVHASVQNFYEPIDITNIGNEFECEDSEISSCITSMSV